MATRRIISEHRSLGSHWLLMETGDGSPTLLRGKDGDPSDGFEPMHNLVGAFGETQHIYGNALDELVKNTPRPIRAVVVGLGLGWVEMLWASMIPSDTTFTLQSYEADDELRGVFVDWLMGRGEGAFWREAFDRVLACVAEAQANSPAELKARLRGLYASGAWQIDGALGTDSVVPENWNLVAFDAYSEETSPELWSAELIRHLLQHADRNGAVLATYAAKSVLRKALIEQGFTLHKRKGFAGKRESTLASYPFVS